VSQRDSGYARIERDAYQTPEWVTAALVPHIPRKVHIHECAAGSGKMALELCRHGLSVSSADIADGINFLTTRALWDAVVTNPPYELAERFIVHALCLTDDCKGFVAMLLRTDYDHAATRKYLFNSPPFAKKLVLTKRIRWIEGSTGQPSFNHAWFIWDWLHTGPAVLAYH
jgi:hypothetical protein